jgi:Co/Zn/Cd efflux system component
VLCFNVGLIVGLVAVGLTAHSLSVLAASGDYFADAVGISVGLFAIKLSRRQPTTQRPSGHSNATTIAALFNGALLLLIVIFVIVEGVHRLAHGSGHVHGVPMVIASSVAAIAMVVGAFILRNDDHLARHRCRCGRRGRCRHRGRDHYCNRRPLLVGSNGRHRYRDFCWLPRHFSTPPSVWHPAPENALTRISNIALVTAQSQKRTFQGIVATKVRHRLQFGH